MKILLAIDGSACSKHALAYLAAHEELLGPDREYTMITVVPPVPPHVGALLNVKVLSDYYHAEAQKTIEPMLAFAEQQKWPVRAVHHVGQPGDVIAQVASEGKFDLVVMGSHGHGAAAGLLLGSVTQRVLAKCSVPVLIVRR
jgi:nucleotide-binding universal stress UspA family protein